MDVFTSCLWWLQLFYFIIESAVQKSHWFLRGRARKTAQKNSLAAAPAASQQHHPASEQQASFYSHVTGGSGDRRGRCGELPARYNRVLPGVLRYVSVGCDVDVLGTSDELCVVCNV